MELTCQRTFYINESLLQRLLRSFFNLTATTTSASSIRPSRKNTRGNGNPAELTELFTTAAGAGGFAGWVFVSADCVITTAPLGASEGDVREERGALEAGAT
jgi:hypothetical protein